jgi:hypothetical protein
MNRLNQGRALFYTRDSGGRHENTPGEYVAWAQRKAMELGVSFAGTPQQIEEMIQQGIPTKGDIFLDYGVPGNVLSRDGLNGLLKVALPEPQITHILIPRRDRLARPDDPMDGVKLENVLRNSGKTLVFMDTALPPLSKGKKQDIAELLVALLAYDRSDQDRHDLAQKMIYAQIRLAKLGFSTGGRPPYGFDRWLAAEDGTPIRALAAGERVRMAGHHVVWVPGSEEKLAVVRRILKLLDTTPACRVAAMLTAEGVPSPDSGRTRKDNGMRHPVSGVWHQTTITSIARNPLLVALRSYGARSMGDKRRYTPEGPRLLEDQDYRADSKPRIVQNPKESQIVVPAKFPAVLEPAAHRELLAKLDARGGSQRGKPRAVDPAQNPLGCRVFDMNCSWPMYREPYNGSFRYKCGLYQQSHGERCAHNHVDGPTATRFVLSCLQQRMLSPGFQTRLEQRLRELAQSDTASMQPSRELAAKQASLAQCSADLERVSGNMALAETPEQYKAVAAVFERLQERKTALEAELAAAEAQIVPQGRADDEIAAALDLAENLTDLVAGADDLSAASEIIRLANARLYLRFTPMQRGKRTVNCLQGGILTLGAASAPIPIYTGATSRKAVKGTTATDAVVSAEDALSASSKNRVCSGRVVNSLGNVSRGDWI